MLINEYVISSVCPVYKNFASLQILRPYVKNRYNKNILKVSKTEFQHDFRI